MSLESYESSDMTDSAWNKDEKKCKSKHIECVYKQVYNLNPLMGGFSLLNDTFESSTFNVYQFTGQYKISAQDNKLVLTTTESCSQASISFVRALVVFQQKVTPQKASTICKQEVEFNENKYTIVISPFEQHDIDVGTIILANNNQLSFSTFKLPSRTDQIKISQSLYSYLKPDSSSIQTKAIQPQVYIANYNSLPFNMVRATYTNVGVYDPIDGLVGTVDFECGTDRSGENAITVNRVLIQPKYNVYYSTAKDHINTVKSITPVTYVSSGNMYIGCEYSLVGSTAYKQAYTQAQYNSKGIVNTLSVATIQRRG
jgi:hypothetical protein